MRMGIISATIAATWQSSGVEGTHSQYQHSHANDNNISWYQDLRGRFALLPVHCRNLTQAYAKGQSTGA